MLFSDACGTFSVFVSEDSEALGSERVRDHTVDDDVSVTFPVVSQVGSPNKGRNWVWVPLALPSVCEASTDLSVAGF